MYQTPSSGHPLHVGVKAGILHNNSKNCDAGHCLLLQPKKTSKIGTCRRSRHCLSSVVHWARPQTIIPGPEISQTKTQQKYTVGWEGEERQLPQELGLVMSM